jgi:hypothetical protein
MQLTAPAVLYKLIEELSLEEAHLSFIQHPVGLNWRQLHTTTTEKARHLSEGLRQSQPTHMFEMTGREYIERSENLNSLVDEAGEVISCTSKILVHGSAYHLAIMNLHPDNDLDFVSLVRVVNAVTANMPGYVLFSGRYYHFYGLRLLEELEWYQFLACWLMPTLVVSPRYIGHSLYRGYAALRLSKSMPHKSTLPYVLSTVNI